MSPGQSPASLPRNVRSGYDVIVVGGGSAGCALAARLAENASRRVLLLEAGRNYGQLDDYPVSMQRGYSASASLPGDSNAWSYVGNLTPKRTYPVTRGKVLGGSSAVNGGQFTRGTPADFNTWVKLGNDEWSFEHVLPFFVKLESDLDFPDDPVHGRDGPVPVVRAKEQELTPVARAFVDACLELGYAFDRDMNAPDSSGVGLLPHNVIGGRRQNMAVTYLASKGIPPNLTVRDLTFVRRIVFDGRRACGVEVVSHGRADVVYGDEIVLCAGGLNSPHLLLLSGIGPADTLRRLGIPVVHHAPGVGRNFMDHPAVQITYRSRYRPRASDLTVAQVCLNYTASGSSHPDDMRIFPYTFPKGGMLFGLRGESLSGRVRGAGVFMRPLRTLRALRGVSLGTVLNEMRHGSDMALYCGLDYEESRGNLILVSADPEIPVRIDYNYLSEQEDLRRLRESVRLGVELLHSKSFAVLGVQIKEPTPEDLRSDRALDSWLHANLATAYHTAGTCRMGPDTDELAVVDQRCRVRGVEGLWVADLSVMPALVRRGPNATAVAIGERVATFFD